jgi:hypothetical protein
MQGVCAYQTLLLIETPMHELNLDRESLRPTQSRVKSLGTHGGGVSVMQEHGVKRI